MSKKHPYTYDDVYHHLQDSCRKSPLAEILLDDKVKEAIIKFAKCHVQIQTPGPTGAMMGHIERTLRDGAWDFASSTLIEALHYALQESHSALPRKTYEDASTYANKINVILLRDIPRHISDLRGPTTPLDPAQKQFNKNLLHIFNTAYNAVPKVNLSGLKSTQEAMIDYITFRLQHPLNAADEGNIAKPFSDEEAVEETHMVASIKQSFLESTKPSWNHGYSDYLEEVDKTVEKIKKVIDREAAKLSVLGKLGIKQKEAGMAIGGEDKK